MSALVHRMARRPAGEVIDTSRHEIALIKDDTTAKAFVVSHHYSGSYPAARFRIGLFERDALVGVAVFSHPVRNIVLRPLPTTTESVELGRFVLLDRVPGNGETWFLARAFELLRREGLVGVVAFSDPLPRTTLDGAVVFKGHVGTIYQAHNAVYLGRANADTMRLLPDGRTLHSRSISKLRKQEQGWRGVTKMLARYGARAPVNDAEAWVVEANRLTRRVRHPGNHKYVWALDPRLRRRLPPSLPYPKKVDDRRAA